MYTPVSTFGEGLFDGLLGAFGPHRDGDDLAAVFLFELERLFECEAIRLVGLEADVGFADPALSWGSRFGDGQRSIFGGDLFDADADLHARPPKVCRLEMQFVLMIKDLGRFLIAGVSIRNSPKRRGWASTGPTTGLGIASVPPIRTAQVIQACYDSILSWRANRVYHGAQIGRRATVSRLLAKPGGCKQGEQQHGGERGRRGET